MALSGQTASEGWGASPFLHGGGLKLLADQGLLGLAKLDLRLGTDTHFHEHHVLPPRHPSFNIDLFGREIEKAEKENQHSQVAEAP